MRKIFKSNFLNADKAAEFLANYGPVYQIQTISNRNTREPEGIIIESDLEKLPEAWIAGKYFKAELAEKEASIAAAKSGKSWTQPKKFKDLSIDPNSNIKQWRHKADVFKKMAKNNVKPTFHQIKIEPATESISESKSQRRKNASGDSNWPKKQAKPVRSRASKPDP